MKPIKNIKLSTINSGIKYQNRDDLLLVELPDDTQIAGVFTKSSTASIAVKICQKHLKQKTAKALIVNAGNANAFTGKQGELAAKNIIKNLANTLNCNQEQIFISSTGVIGEALKEELIINKLDHLKTNLSEEIPAWQKAAKAITTTDTFSKIASKTIKIDGEEIIINGFAKGSGMIAPNMATMLAYIFTNANISADILQMLLSEINEETFNAITVDSDTSTSDTVLLFATNQSNHQKITDIKDQNLIAFKAALKDVMLDLAKQIVIDGEGATKLIEIEVLSAKTQESAKKIALAIANSPLVKTAIAGADPNWGRIIMAIGKSQEKVEEEKLDIKIGQFDIVKNGQLINDYNENPIHKYLQEKEVKIIINLNLTNKNSKNNATIYTCDFTEGYIKINKDYRS